MVGANPKRRTSRSLRLPFIGYQIDDSSTGFSETGEGPEDRDWAQHSDGNSVSQIRPNHAAVIQNDKYGAERQAENREQVPFFR